MSIASPPFEIWPCAAYLVNLQGQLLEVNQAARSLSGRKELENRDFLEAFVADEDRAACSVYLKEVLEGADDGKAFKVTFLTATGRKQVCLRSTCLRNKGKLDGAILTAQDLGDMRALLGTAGGGAEHLSGALSASGMALFCVNTEGTVLEWTPQLEKLTGLSGGQAQGQAANFFITESSREKFEQAMEQARGGNEVDRFLVEVQTASGRSVELMLRISPWRSTTGRLVGALGIFEAAEEKVTEGEWIVGTYASQLDLANALIFSVDYNMCITEWNQHLSEMTSKEKAEVVGKDLSQFSSLAGKNATAVLAGFQAPPVAITLFGVNMVVGFSPQMSFNGKVIGALAVGQLGCREWKDQILHEIRAPLHGILGLAKTLSQEQGPHQKALSMISDTATRALELATSIMDYWRFIDLEVRPSSKREERIGFEEVAAEAIAAACKATDKKGKAVKGAKVEIKSEIQAVSASVDYAGMSQLLRQLLLNALAFTKQGEVLLQVRKQEESVCIEVRDTGLGMKPADAERIRKAFAQTSLGSRSEGLGLGLSIVREVLRIHQGSLEIKSAEGTQGTQLTVLIPCSPPERKPKVIRPSKPGSSSWLGPAAHLGIELSKQEAVRQGSRTATSLPSNKEEQGFAVREEGNLIMSVDDDFVNQEVMRSILEPCGFRVVACMTGTECLEYLEGGNERPNLILLDLMMPGLSGFDVLEEMKKKVSPSSVMELPVLMVSAKNQTSSVVKGYDLGAADYIHKPFCREELIARVKYHLKMRSALLHMRYRISAAGTPSQDNFAVIQEEKGRASLMLEVEQEDAVPVTDPLDTTALFASFVDEELSPERLAPILEEFERLSATFNTYRTEVFGSSYVAIAWDTGDETRHTDQLLRLATAILQKASQESLGLTVGIHTDAVVSASFSGRQYPKTSFFSQTLQRARALGDAAAIGRVLLSRSARCRLTADVEAELQQRGLKLMAGSQQPLGEHFFFLAHTGERDPQPLKGRKTSKAQDENEERRMAQLQEELKDVRSRYQELQKQLLMTDEQLRKAKMESDVMQQRLQQTQVSGLRQDVVPEVSKTAPTSVLFLQWQNAHLQAEIRQYQSALSNTKAELQMQILTSQLWESKHELLQARQEHLELDLQFQASQSMSEEKKHEGDPERLHDEQDSLTSAMQSMAPRLSSSLIGFGEPGEPFAQQDMPSVSGLAPFPPSAGPIPNRMDTSSSCAPRMFTVLSGSSDQHMPATLGT